MPGRLTDEQVDRIVELWKRGYSILAIHRETGNAIESIRKVVVNRCNDSPEKRQKRKTDEMNGFFKNEYLNGMSIKEISEKYRCDYDRVREYLKKNVPEYKGITFYKDRFTDEEIRMIVDEYYKNESSNKMICRKWHICDQTLKRLVVYVNNLKE